MPLQRNIIDRTLATSQGEAAYGVTEMLMDAGYECFWVGGAPRDMLRGLLPVDIDMAVSAKPEEIAKLFPKCDDTAASLGSVVVSHKGQRFELTTFRSDKDTGDGRRPDSVIFGDRNADALRRDATINAMYWNPVSRELFDPCGGETDLKAKVVRFIGDPDARVKQDALRILRLVRVRALIGGTYEKKTEEALRNNATLTTTLSGVRILEELEKMLRLPKPSKAFRDLSKLGILTAILPELSACKGVQQPPEYHQEGDVLDHLLQCIDACTDDHGPDVRIAALLHDAGKPQTFAVKERIRFDHHAEVSGAFAETVLRRLHMPAARIEKIRWLIVHHMMMGTFKNLNAERKAHWYFHPWFRELLQLFFLDIAGTTPQDFVLYDSIVDDYDEFLNAHPRPQKPLLSGDDIMKILGLQAGEAVGIALKALHDAQIRKEVTTKKEAKEFLLKHDTSIPETSRGL